MYPTDLSSACHCPGIADLHATPAHVELESSDQAGAEHLADIYQYGEAGAETLATLPPALARAAADWWHYVIYTRVGLLVECQHVTPLADGWVRLDECTLLFPSPIEPHELGRGIELRVADIVAIIDIDG